MNGIFRLAGNIISVSTGFLAKIGGVAPGEHDNEVVIVSQLNAAVENPISSRIIVKGFGNTDLTQAENGDYSLVTNSDNTFVIQFYTGGAWDTDNETELATPS